MLYSEDLKGVRLERGYILALLSKLLELYNFLKINLKKIYKMQTNTKKS
jgi:DNA phosphorothioation-dependent restriction protein DptG